MAKRKRQTAKSEALDVALLAQPSVPDLLADIDGGVENLLPFSATKLPLRVEFPMWANSHPSQQMPESVDLFWNGELVSSKSWSNPVKPTELFIMAPTSKFAHGEHALHYEVTLYNDTTAVSRPLTINIDLMAPAIPDGKDQLVFDAKINADGVTEEYLQAHGDKVEAKIPPYNGAEVGDMLRWYWSADPAGKQMAGMLTLGKDDVKQLSPDRKAPLMVAFEGDFIRQARDGLRFARYEIQDRAGTSTQRSLVNAITTKAAPPPRVLLPPTLKEIPSGSDYFSTLLPAAATNGVTFVIPASVEIRPNEKVTIYWGKPGTVGAYETSTPITAGSREYHVPKAHVPPYMGHQAELYYQIDHPDVPQSPSHFVTVREITGLPIVQCSKVENAELNLRTLGDSAAFTLGEWPLRNTSQFVRAWIEGVDRNDLTQVITLSIADDVPVTSETGDMALGSVTKVALERLAVNYQFRVVVRVSFDDKTTWLRFPDSAATLINR